NVIRRYVAHPGLASVMLQYSLLDRRPEEAVLDLLYQHKVGVLVRGSLAQGLLINKAPKPYLEHAEETVARAAAALKKAADPMQPATVAVKYVLQNPAVTAAVLGIRTKEQLEEAFKIAAASPLSSTQTETLQKIIPAILYKQHR
ncbi:MAG: aldo/keto reductase, partial [Bacteroidetes bacterium]|nr:aldo/keto reductase [Bacteroidota bacterium]